MKFSAVILAGGKSSRMGRDKAFLEIDRRTLLNRQIDTLHTAGAEDVLISGREGTNYSAFGCRVVKDHITDAGPLAGIHAALKAIKHPLLLVLAVDLPDMNAMFLRGLLMAANRDKGVIPRVNGQIEPLAAIYPRAALQLVESMTSTGSFAARDFAGSCVQKQLAAYLEVSEEFSRLFKNLNSPGDIETMPSPT